MPQPLPVEVTSTWWDYVVDIADILAGLGTMGALAVAALVYKHQIDDRRRTQANNVSAWLAALDDGLYFNLQNSSGAPVYEVWTTFEAYGRDLGYKYTDVLRPSAEPRQYIIPEGVVSNPDYENDNNFAGGNHENLRARITFRDTANRYWKRNKDGFLVGPLSRKQALDPGAVEWWSNLTRDLKAERLKNLRSRPPSGDGDE